MLPSCHQCCQPIWQLFLTDCQRINPNVAKLPRFSKIEIQESIFVLNSRESIGKVSHVHDAHFPEISVGHFQA
jgi:hypothetical protein